MKRTFLSVLTLLCMLTGLLAFPVTAGAAGRGGFCDVNLMWSLDGETLTISGTGAMTDYGGYDEAPWYRYGCS